MWVCVSFSDYRLVRFEGSGDSLNHFQFTCLDCSEQKIDRYYSVLFYVSRPVLRVVSNTALRERPRSPFPGCSGILHYPCGVVSVGEACAGAYPFAAAWCRKWDFGACSHINTQKL